MRTYHGKRLDALAEEVRKTYVRFPHTTRIVFDHRGLGDAFPQFLSQPWIIWVGFKDSAARCSPGMNPSRHPRR